MQKQFFKGTARRKRVDIGLRSEHEIIVLERGNGLKDLELRIKHRNPYLDQMGPLVGKTLVVEGMVVSGLSQILVDTIADITVLSPQVKKTAPRPPRP